MKSAEKHGRVKAKNFTAMLRLDHNRALAQISHKTGKPVSSFKKLAVWGNHSPTMYPDFRFATADGTTRSSRLSTTIRGTRETFIPTVGKRGAAIIEARGLAPPPRPPTPPSITSMTGGWAPKVSGSPWAFRRRLLRHPAGRGLRLSLHDRKRRVQDRPRPRDRRLLQGEDREYP